MLHSCYKCVGRCGQVTVQLALGTAGFNEDNGLPSEWQAIQKVHRFLEVRRQLISGEDADNLIEQPHWETLGSGAPTPDPR
jgi:hypothetical protein